MARLFWRYDLPVVAGNELSGEVAEVGTGVTRFAVGERVFSRVDHQKMGAFATYAVVDANLVGRMPESLDFDEAAALPLAGLTALQGLRDHLSVTSGDRLFITGGAGGVGTLAIQLAVWMGATVATTVSDQGEKLADHLGPRRSSTTGRRSSRTSCAITTACSTWSAGGISGDCFDILKRGAKVVSIAGVPEPKMVREDVGLGRFWVAGAWAISAKIRRQARRRRVGYRCMLMHPSGDDLSLLARLVDEGQLKPVIDQVFPFPQIADALSHVEQGHTKGKVVVRL